VTQERQIAGTEVGDGAGSTGAVSSTPAGDHENDVASVQTRPTEPAKAEAKLGAGTGTKKFEAPHRLEKETFFTHVTGLTLLSFWRTSSWIMGHLPAGPTYRVGGWLSMVGYAASPERRRWLRGNFSHVLGVSPDDKAAHRMARAAYRNYSRYIMELMRLPWLKPDKVDQLLEVKSLDKFIEVYRASKGMVLVAAHLGNNEAAAAGFAKQGLEINVVGDDSSYRELYELFERQRESWGVKMISWRNLRGVYGALRRHEGLVLLVDWGYREDGIPVKMFGAWTTLPAGPALLAAKHGSAIVPFSINRLPDGTFRAAADDPIYVASTSPADLARATQAIATALEGHISPAPEQWYIFKTIWPETAQEAAALEARHAAVMAAEAAEIAGAARGADASETGDGAPPRRKRR
jgi:KDO2-lipid IV(A) lauroyltransferase